MQATSKIRKGVTLPSNIVPLPWGEL